MTEAAAYGSMRSDPQDWLSHFRASGYADPEPLGAGMEGSTYRLRPGTVAKVWVSRSVEELALLQTFHTELENQDLPFKTPRIIRIEQVGGTSVTYETELPGRALRNSLDGKRDIPPAAIGGLSEVLEALASTTPGPAAGKLAVLSEPSAFHLGDWGQSLLALLERRVSRFGAQLREAVPHFDRLYAATREAIGRFADIDESFVHGDLCPENILVNGELAPVAVIDWGFLSTAGDPMFDVAVSAGIFEMYGPHAANTERALDQRFTATFGCSAADLLVYRAAYAIATANAYDINGRDGHFEWCAALLRRRDSLAAIESAVR